MSTPTPETTISQFGAGLTCPYEEVVRLSDYRKLEQKLAIAKSALELIAKCEDAPDVDIGGEWQFGLHCGVEDRCCSDRYEGADYGYTVGAERALEWASNEAKHALTIISDHE